MNFLTRLLLISVFHLIKSDATDGIHSEENKKYHKELVERINSQTSSTWTAAYNRYADTKEQVHNSDLALYPSESYEQLLAADPTNLHETVEQFQYLAGLSLPIPREYDVRKQWSQCWSVHQIFNQGPCGSCWAIASTSVMSDRICIALNGTVSPLLSTEDLISCCDYCGGCKGSIWTISPFTYWKTHGIVTGGAYGSCEGCRPYSFEPHCGAPCSVPKYSKTARPKCQKSCQEYYTRSHEEDTYKGKSAYWLRVWVLGLHLDNVRRLLDNISGEYLEKESPATFYTKLIQREILLNGPVLACTAIFEEFQHYSHGIYHHLEGEDEMYGHCMKLLGWGSENGTRFWIYANTWGRHWGEGGFFRVRMDELPEEVVAGQPLL